MPVARGVHVMENHDAALEHWRGAAQRGRVLVHVDAHHDLWWTPDATTLSIASFMCPALAEGLVREVCWVVPDASFETRFGRRALRLHLAEIHRRCGARGVPCQWGDRQVRTRVLDRPIVVCTLDTCPAPSEPVLLDIDVDFLVIPRVFYAEPDAHSPLPWIWPADLMRRIEAAGLRWDLLTIAYSVDGGFTPLAWKYLGDELAARARGRADDAAVRLYDEMRAAAEAEHRGDTMQAEARFRELGDSAGAAPHLRLAYLLAAQGRVDEGRAHYRRAQALDASYLTPYASPGMTLWFAGVRRNAEEAFALTLRLDPADACAHLGLGWVAAGHGDWSGAETRARKALDLDAHLIDAHRLLGRALAEQRRDEEAIAAYEQSMALALAGAQPLEGVITSAPSHGRLLDADHPRVHARLARLYARTGQRERAIVGYRLAIGAGYSSPSVRFSLAALLARRGAWAAAGRQAMAGAGQLPSSVRTWVRRQYSRRARG